MKYGFIGCGNMGSAIAQALSRTTNNLLLSDPDPKVHDIARICNCQTADNTEIANCCDRIFLAVKPQVFPEVLSPIKHILCQRKPTIITMAAGIEIQKIEELIGTSLPVIRIMPNTAVSVGKGLILYCSNDLVSTDLLNDFLKDMTCAGNMDQLDEHLIDAASALSGSGPAYMYVFMEALADGAVACGLPRDKAISYAAMTMEGAAQMLLTTQQHPGVLKDAVCSPGGSTIAGINQLEERGFRGTAMNCVIAAYEKNLDLGR